MLKRSTISDAADVRIVSRVAGILLLALAPAPVAAAEAEYMDKRLACAIVGTDVLDSADSLADEEHHKEARSLLLACLGRSNICAIGSSALPSGEAGDQEVLYEGNRTADIPSTERISVLARSINTNDYKLCTVVSVQLGTASGWNFSNWIIAPDKTEKDKLLTDSCRTEKLEDGQIDDFTGDDRPARSIAVQAWKILEKTKRYIDSEAAAGSCEGVTDEECAEAEAALAQEFAELEKDYAAGARKKCE